jgi:hypothetical protein
MKLLAWAVFVVITGCFCMSFYLQQVETRSLEVRQAIGIPDPRWQKFLQQCARKEEAAQVEQKVEQKQPVEADAAVVATEPQELPY